jgi:hypothetical protein
MREKWEKGKPITANYKIKPENSAGCSLLL